MAFITSEDLQRHLTSLVGTRARRRMTIITAAAMLFSLFTAGIEQVAYPLWATRELGLTASQWAQLRSLRMTGTLIGVVILGALSDRFGQRLVGSISMFGVAAVLAALGTGKVFSVWVAMPITGALVSTAFVNLNTLTQQISDRRQGLANAIYRSTGALAAIAAPVLVTWLAAEWHGYAWVFLSFAAVLMVAGAVLLLYPGEQTPPPLGDLQKEVARQWQGYLLALRQRELVRFIHYSQLWGNTLAGVGAYSAIRFTQDLGLSEVQFGLLSTISLVLALVSTASVGLFLDRVSIRRLVGVTAIVASLCVVVMGLKDSPVLAAAGYLAYIPLVNMLAGPNSMWVSRAAGEGTQTAAFSVHKVATALYVALTMALLSVLERWIGMRNILLFGGMLGVLVGICLLRLPDPPRPTVERLPRQRHPAATRPD